MRSRQERRAFLRRLVAMAGTVSITGCGTDADEPSQGRTATPVVLPAPSPGAGPTPPSMTDPIPFTLLSAKGGAGIPFCFAQPFRKGDVPAGKSLVSSPANIQIQVTAQNRWPDGSLKLAIIAGQASLPAGAPLVGSLSVVPEPARVAALDTKALRATGVTAAVRCGSFGTVAWSGADWDQPFLTWVAGPWMTSWVYRKAVGSDAHLVAWLEVRLFASGAVEVLPWIENGYLQVPGPTNKSATYEFTLG